MVKHAYQKALKAITEARRKEMLKLWEAGNTLQGIGERYSITRERVRQILGVRKDTGGANVRAVPGRIARAEARLDRLNKRSLRAWLCPYSEYLIIMREEGPYGPRLEAYSQQKKHAKRRGIGWKISLPDWWRIWKNSGKWAKRGQGQYGMSRIRDNGPYEIGNVRIATQSENAREAISLAGGPKNWGWQKTGLPPRKLSAEEKAAISARVKEQWAKRKAAGFNAL